MRAEGGGLTWPSQPHCGSHSSSLILHPSSLKQEVRYAQLQQQPELVAEAPALLPLAAGETRDVHRRHADAFAGGRQSVEGAFVGAMEIEAHPCLLAVGDEAVDRVAPFGYRGAESLRAQTAGDAVIMHMLERFALA